MVPLSFAFLFKSFNAKQGSELESRIQQSLVSRNKTICSYVHVLAVVLHPLISTHLYFDLIPLLEIHPIIDISQRAFEKDISYSRMLSKQATICVRFLDLHCSGERPSALFENYFHPFLLWSTIGIELCSMLSSTTLLVLT